MLKDGKMYILVLLMLVVGIILLSVLSANNLEPLCDIALADGRINNPDENRERKRLATSFNWPSEKMNKEPKTDWPMARQNPQMTGQRNHVRFGKPST